MVEKAATWEWTSSDRNQKENNMDIVEKSEEVQKQIEGHVKQIGKGKYGRVMKMARKPTPEEFSKTVQVTGLGILLLGGLGFLIWWLWTNVPDYFRGLL